MPTTTKTIAVKFNQRNKFEFAQLNLSKRLNHINLCMPTGTLSHLSFDEAREVINSGRNVYADIASR
jgi:hypothetical protein